MNKRLKKRIAAILAVIMCMAMMPAWAFADNGEDTQEETKNLLVFGDSTSSGYGLPDHDFAHNSFNVRNNDLTTWTVELARDQGRISNSSHPWQMKEYIAEKEFGGDLSKVNLSSMCFGGTRTDELRALLDNEYYEKINQYEIDNTAVHGAGVGFVTDHIRDYTSAMHLGGAKVNGHLVDSVVDAQAYTKQEVEKADVIVVDVCTNNFGTYLARRIAGRMQVQGFNEAFLYYKQTIDDIDDLSAENKARINKLRKSLLSYLKIDENDDSNMMIVEFMDALLFCYASCLTNYSADIELLREINPDAKIIAVGIFNSLQGTTLVVDGKDVALGDFGNIIFNSINAYMKAIDKNSDKYYFADVTGGIETFVDQIAKAESLEDIEKDKDGRHFMDQILNGLRSLLLDGMELNDVQTVRARQLLFDASKCNKASIYDLIAGLSDNTKAKNELKNYINGTGEYPSYATMSLVHMEERFMLDYGVGQHPSRNGCLQKAAAVKEAYEKDETAYEETKSQIAAKLLELKELLNGTPAYDNLDRIVTLIEQIDAIMPMIDEAESMLAMYRNLKEEFFRYYGEALDMLGITEEELIERGKYISENIDAEKVADLIRRMDAVVHDWPELEKKYGPQIREYVDKLMDLVEFTIDFMNENKDLIDKVDMEQLAKVIVDINDFIKTSPELYAKYGPVVREYAEEIYDILEPAIKTLIDNKDEIIDALDIHKIADYVRTAKKVYDIASDVVRSDSLEDALNKLEDIVFEKAGLLSADLYDQIRQIALMLNDQIEGKSMDEIMESLKPIFEQLREIGTAVYNLPEYEKAIDAYSALLDKYAEENAELRDQVQAMKAEIAALAASYIEPEIKAAVGFDGGKAYVIVSWEADEDAAGYVLKVDGQEVEATMTDTGFIYKHTGVKIGQSYNYEVTPYVLYRHGDESDVIYGDTFKKTVVPKVTLKRVKIKKVTAAKKALKVKWKKVKGADGYRIYYKKAGKKAKYMNVKGAKKVSKTVKKLASRKKYTIKVQAWKKVNGNEYYGSWSKAKKAKAK